MTDRELLELAAKAAGIGTLDFDYAERESHGMYFGPRLPMPEGVVMAAVWNYWRPLEDDGDALRLAVKLRINVEHMETMNHKPHGINCWPIGRGDCGISETDISDYAAATRRAIVRAAAEISKAML